MTTIKKISIITIVYNDCDNIEKTILSITNQINFETIEYIIIDGSSSDGTLEIINKYKNKIDKIISEKDNGIYDAMNKGIKIANCEWINFMNSGDSFYTNQIIHNFLNIENKSNFDIFYGSVNCVSKKGSFIQNPLQIEQIKNKLPFCHQSCFVKTKLLKKYKFDNNYKIASDYNFFYLMYKLSFKFIEIDVCIANYDIDNGISATRYYSLQKEIMIINGKWNSFQSRISLFLNNIKFKLNKNLKNYLHCLV